MKPPKRNRRLGLIGVVAVLLAGSAFLVFAALERNVSYFYTPSEALAAGVSPDATIRLGGLVEAQSVSQRADAATRFVVTDGAHSIEVVYEGILPDLFREGQGVIAQGRFDPEGVFVADVILAKHDENYVPRELAEIVELPDE